MDAGYRKNKGGFRLGVTGCSGSGTSTVARFFKEKGVPTLSADLLARQCTLKGHPALKKINGEFPGVRREDGSLDRRKLAQIVFQDRTGWSLRKLNEIIHPYVIRDMKAFIREHRGTPLVVMDIPLLFEVGFEKFLDGVMLVRCPRAERIKRIRRRDSITYREIRARFLHQMPEREKAKKARWKISNGGTREQLAQQLDEFYRKHGVEIFHGTGTD